MKVNINDLFKGIAIVIDDEIDIRTKNINNIVKQIESLNIPVKSYNTIPNMEIIEHFQGLSFVLLDWNLIGSSYKKKGVKIPEQVKEESYGRIIDFIKNLKKVCYCPIFIFSNDTKEHIQDRLSDSGLFSDEKPSNILIESKGDLLKENILETTISNWVENNPSIYVLKEWEKEYHKCKNQMFNDFQDINPVWPNVMWKCFGEDGVNKSLELGELISRNLITRMQPFHFRDDILLKNDKKPAQSEIRSVIEGTKFIKSLDDNDISTGDIYKIKEAGASKYIYYLNIRAHCDLLRTTNPEIYCISGCELKQDKDGCLECQDIKFFEGNFHEKSNHAIVPFIDNGKIIEFKFKCFKIIKLKDLVKTHNRIGRLLPPYIVKIQQQFSNYIHRQGLPRIPCEAYFHTLVEKNENENGECIESDNNKIKEIKISKRIHKMENEVNDSYKQVIK